MEKQKSRLLVEMSVFTWWTEEVISKQKTGKAKGVTP
jgi:hypothetical protein